MNISRQRAIHGALAALAIPSAAFAQAALPAIKVGTQPAEFTADIMYGIQEGFFQKAGVSIDLQYLTNGNITSEAILSGAVDVGLNDTLGVAQAHVRGVDLVFLSPAAEFASPWPTGFVTLPEANIRAAADFNNKTIGTRGLRSAPNMMASAWIDNNGGDSKTIKWVEIVSTTAIAAIRAHRIDGVLIGEPYFTQAKEEGLRITMLDHNPPSNAWMVNGWAARRSWADANPDPVRRFTTGMRDANHWANTHEAATYPIVAAYTKIPQDVVAKMMSHPWIETLTPSLVQPVIDVCARYGVLSRNFPAAEIFYTAH
jgi:NitT/TauT family transport system substrate-binding protein